jgi:uncharacterized membrane protein YeaQ/YmgE (transglycosylase-associated protein family)
LPDRNTTPLHAGRQLPALGSGARRIAVIDRSGLHLVSSGWTMEGSIDADEAREAVRDLEWARRDNRRRQIDIWEALYQAYMVGFTLIAVTAMASSLLPSQPVSAATTTWLTDRGGALIGLVVAAAAMTGLRSGARGGPLSFDPPTVAYVLQSPVDRAFVTRRAALAQLRTAVLWGALGGAATGLAFSQALPGSILGLALGFTATGVAAGLMLIGCALVTSGQRWRVLPVTAVGAVIMIWSAIDLVAATRTSPASFLGSAALWDVTHQGNAFVFVAFAIVAAVAVAGVAVSGGVSLEASQRRAGLVSQIRFALTMQDLRTVVLLRRRMTQSLHRRDPWLPVGRSKGNKAPVFRRSLQSNLRLPGGSLAMLAVLAAAAGISFGAASRGPAALALLPGLFLFFAAYDVLEPLAQEADHPTRWMAHPVRPGDVIRSLTAAGAAFMIVLGLIAAAVAAPLLSDQTSPAALIALPLGSVGATVGAAVGTMMGNSGSGAMQPMQSEVFGVYVVLRVVVPLLPALIPFAPAAAALATHGGNAGATAFSSLVHTLVPAEIAWLWLGSKAPEPG